MTFGISEGKEKLCSNWKRHRIQNVVFHIHNIFRFRLFAISKNYFIYTTNILVVIVTRFLKYSLMFILNLFSFRFKTEILQMHNLNNIVEKLIFIQFENEGGTYGGYYLHMPESFDFMVLHETK